MDYCLLSFLKFNLLEYLCRKENFENKGSDEFLI